MQNTVKHVNIHVSTIMQYTVTRINTLKSICTIFLSAI